MDILITGTGALACLFAARLTQAGHSVTMLGTWKEGDGASTRLLAWLDTFGQEGLGRLLGIHKPVAAPRVRTLDDALVLEATFDAETLAQGLHDGIDADIREIMSR